MNERHLHAHAVSYLNSIEFKADGASHKKGIITDDIRDHTYIRLILLNYRLHIWFN